MCIRWASCLNMHACQSCSVTRDRCTRAHAHTHPFLGSVAIVRCSKVHSFLEGNLVHLGCSYPCSHFLCGANACHCPLAVTPRVGSNPQVDFLFNIGSKEFIFSEPNILYNLILCSETRPYCGSHVGLGSVILLLLLPKHRHTDAFRNATPSLYAGR